MTSDKKSPWFYPIPESTVENLLNPVVEPIGKGLGGIAGFVMRPFIKLGVINEHNMEQFERKMMNKNNSIPIENRDNSKQGLALKALEDSVYQLDSEDLQEMFATLIASSLDKQRNSEVLPSFSSILKDFTSTDAKLFEVLYELNAVVKVDLNLSNISKSMSLPCLSNIILFDDGSMSYEPVSINTLERFGLIEIQTASLVQPNYTKNYRNFREKDNEFYQHAEKQLEKLRHGNPPFDSIQIDEGYITLTNLGKKFGSVVLS